MVGVILLGKLQGLNPGVLMTGQTREGEQREVGGHRGEEGISWEWGLFKNWESFLKCRR